VGVIQGFIPLPLIPALAVFDPEAQTRRELVAGSREGIFLKSEKKILRMKNVRIYAFSATLRGKSGLGRAA